MKVLVNRCYGGFGISKEALHLYLTTKGYKYKMDADEYTPSATLEDGKRISVYEIDRDDPVLIEVFEKIGSEACSGDHSELELVEIPDGCVYDVTEYDGFESIEYWLEVTFDEVRDGLSAEKLDIFAKCGRLELKHEQ